MTNYSVVCAKVGRVIKARIISARARAYDLVYLPEFAVRIVHMNSQPGKQPPHSPIFCQYK